MMNVHLTGQTFAALPYSVQEAVLYVDAYPIALWIGLIANILLRYVFMRKNEKSYNDIIFIFALNIIAASNFFLYRRHILDKSITNDFITALLFLPPTGMIFVFLFTVAVYQYINKHITFKIPIYIGLLLSVAHGYFTGMLLYGDR